MSEATFMVGKTVELSHEECRQLDELSREMQRLASRQKVGWLLPWLQAHRAAHLVLKRAFQRSHELQS